MRSLVMALRVLTSLGLLLGRRGLAFAIPYEEYILAPSSRFLHPVSVKETSGTVRNAEALLDGNPGATTFEGDSWITLDYGKNIGGLLSIDVDKVSEGGASVGITFSESPVFISPISSDGQSDGGRGEKIYISVTPDQRRFTLPQDRTRGGFRYVTLSTKTREMVEISTVTTYFTPVPHRDPRDYTGYFHSDDELLNRIWYAGAYTNQMNTIEPTTGESNFGGLTAEGTYTWSLNTTVCDGIACVVDGAKRDRLVWPGDLVIQTQTMAVSTYDMTPLRDSVEALFFGQAEDGMMPYLGWDFQGRKHSYVSFTYHLHNLISFAHYVRYSGDEKYLANKWPDFVRAVEWSLSHIDDTGIMNVTSNRDWLRVGMGGHNIEANAILIYTLRLGSELALRLSDDESAESWTQHAQTIKKGLNTLLWDSEAHMYRDNETTALHPQDGNVWAILSNLTESAEQAEEISSALQARWGTYGAPAPEAYGTTISPFISGLECESSLVLRNPTRALDLIRLQWGYMLDGEPMTNSTFVEGYSTDGSLVYKAYSEYSRISHAHGWSTAPTYLLTTYVGGIHVEEHAGSRWRVEPLVGDLKDVHTGFSTRRGEFSVEIKADGEGGIRYFKFCAPKRTKGIFILPGDGHLRQGRLKMRVLGREETEEVGGGCWEFKS